MKIKKYERMIEEVVRNIYKGLQPLKSNEVISKEILDIIIRNIAAEIVKVSSISNQAMY